MWNLHLKHSLYLLIKRLIFIYFMRNNGNRLSIFNFLKHIPNQFSSCYIISAIRRVKNNCYFERAELGWARRFFQGRDGEIFLNTKIYLLIWMQDVGGTNKLTSYSGNRSLWCMLREWIVKLVIMNIYRDGQGRAKCNNNHDCPQWWKTIPPN